MSSPKLNRIRPLVWSGVIKGLNHIAVRYRQIHFPLDYSPQQKNQQKILRYSRLGNTFKQSYYEHFPAFIIPNHSPRIGQNCSPLLFRIGIPSMFTKISKLSGMSSSGIKWPTLSKYQNGNIYLAERIWFWTPYEMFSTKCGRVFG